MLQTFPALAGVERQVTDPFVLSTADDKGKRNVDSITGGFAPRTGRDGKQIGLAVHSLLDDNFICTRYKGNFNGGVVLINTLRWIIVNLCHLCSNKVFPIDPNTSFVTQIQRQLPYLLLIAIWSICLDVRSQLFENKLTLWQARTMSRRRGNESEKSVHTDHRCCYGRQDHVFLSHARLMWVTIHLDIQITHHDAIHRRLLWTVCSCS